jgi:hypothetical protein
MIRTLILAAVILTTASSASAQIISTMALKDAGRRSARGHVMFGYAAWDFGADFIYDWAAEVLGGSVEGGSRSGVIVAGEVPLTLSPTMTMAVGGWHNHSGTRVTTLPPSADFSGQVARDRSTFSSVYVNVFYRYAGVQVGVVPVRIEESISSPSTGLTERSSRRYVDVTVFGMARVTAVAKPRVVLTAALGVYRYSARSEGLILRSLFDVAEFPAKLALSGFVLASIDVSSHVTVDVSFWKTAAHNPQFVRDNQARLTMGVGITF